MIFTPCMNKHYGGVKITNSTMIPEYLNPDANSSQVEAMDVDEDMSHSSSNAITEEDRILFGISAITDEEMNKSNEIKNQLNKEGLPDFPTPNPKHQVKLPKKPQMSKRKLRSFAFLMNIL